MSLLISCSMRTLGACVSAGSIGTLSRSSELFRCFPLFVGAFRGSLAAGASKIQQLQRPSFSTDSHDDFKPKVKEGGGGAAPSSAEELIKRDVTTNEVFIFMKGAQNRAGQHSISYMFIYNPDSLDWTGLRPFLLMGSPLSAERKREGEEGC